MNRVEFHYNVADKLGYTCRLLGKILARDLKVVVIAPPSTLRALDETLWSADASSFIPHCFANAPAGTLAASPIWLAESWPAGARHEVMVNLGPTVPEHFDKTQRYLEVVSTDEADAKAGRLRWRQYQEMGMAIERFDRGAQA